MREIGDIVRQFDRGPRESFALATLIQTQGSSYRRPGARMLVAREGEAVGSLSGGCLEDEVGERAREVLAGGEPVLMSFDTRRRFGCNGSLKIFVERLPESFLAGLSACFHARLPCTIATPFVPQGGSRLVTEDLAPSADELLQRIPPRPQLLIVGEGPDSLALATIAGALGWLVRPMLPTVPFEDSYDQWTAAVIKTHNYGRDFAALRALLPLKLRYIGLMGPRARRDQLLGDLLDTGTLPSGNFFAPAGLDLGSESPEAIALAIVSEIQAVFTGGSREFLRDRRMPIHAHQPEPTPVLP